MGPEYDAYFGIAVASTVLFALKALMLIFGGDLDFGDDGDIDFDIDDVESGTDTFSILSYQSALAFFMLFGWTALAMRFEYGFTKGMTLLGATGAGFFGAFLSAYLMSLVKKLNSEPLPKKPAVGMVGHIYIPPTDMPGVVNIPHNGTTREFKAVSETGALIQFGVAVEVIDNSRDVLIVKPI